MPQVLPKSQFVEYKTAPLAILMTALKKSGNAALDFLTQVSIAQSRTAQIEQMNLLSDHELAERFQINRDQIVTYVFRDKMY